MVWDRKWKGWIFGFAVADAKPVGLKSSPGENTMSAFADV